MVNLFHHIGIFFEIVTTIRSFPHSCLVTGFLSNSNIRNVSLLKQVLHTISVHCIILMGFHAVPVVQLLVFMCLFTYTSVQHDFHVR
jgi:hypothetical protein